MRRLAVFMSSVIATLLAACSATVDIDRPTNQTYRLTRGDILPAPYDRFVYSGKSGASRVNFTEFEGGRPIRTLNLPFLQGEAIPLDGTTQKRLMFSGLDGDTLRVVFRNSHSTHRVE